MLSRFILWIKKHPIIFTIIIIIIIITSIYYVIVLIPIILVIILLIIYSLGGTHKDKLKKARKLVAKYIKLHEPEGQIIVSIHKVHISSSIYLYYNDLMNDYGLIQKFVDEDQIPPEDDESYYTAKKMKSYKDFIDKVKKLQ